MCDCMDEFNFNLHNYRQVNQQSVAAKSVSSSSLPQISCLLAVAQYITWISCDLYGFLMRLVVLIVLICISHVICSTRYRFLSTALTHG